MKQSSTDLNRVKEAIKALGEKSDVSERKISELDSGNQGLLEKLLGLENGLDAKIKDLDESDSKLKEEINGLRSDNGTSISQIQSHFTEKVSEVNNSLTSVSSSLREETKILSEKIDVSQTQQTALEKKMVDMDSGNQQLLDKLLAVEQDLDGKLRGVNDHSSNLVEKINSLDTENRDNAQKIVTIQESLVLQSQNINKVESERQTSEANAKKELEATVDKNVKAISDLKAEIEIAIQSVENNLANEHQANTE